MPIHSGQAVSSACHHCGNPVPSERSIYCCPGCQTVAAILHERGWDRFYQIREKDPKPLIPLRDEEAQTFEYLASPGYIEANISVKSDHWHFTWYLQSVHCAACLWLVDKVCKTHHEVLSSDCRLEDGRIRLVTKQNCDLPELARQFAQVGLAPALAPSEDEDQNPELLRLGLSGALAANIMLFSLPFYVGLDDPRFATLFGWLAAFLSFPLVWIGGHPFFRRAWSSFKLRQFHFDQPIAIGIASAFLLSFSQLVFGAIDMMYFDSMAMLIFFLLLGRYLRMATLGRARRASSKLLNAMPRMVRVWRQGAWQLCEAENVAQGDRLKLLPGDVLPVDGALISESALVNLQVVSGETHPQDVLRGTTLLAGTINLNHPIEVIANSTARNAELAKLEDLSRDLQQNRPTLTHSKTAGWFLACVSLSALTGGILWWPVSPFRGLETVLTIFIVACPCALALAGPTAQAFALHRAAQLGIWIKNLRVFRALPEVTEFVFDKTGVLTEGNARVTQLQHFSANPKWLESAIACMEAEVDHPIAVTLRNSFTPHLALGPVTHFQVLGGVGISGQVGGQNLIIAGPHALNELDLDAGAVDLALAACAKLPASSTQIAVFLNGQLAAVIALEDPSRPEAAQVVAAFQHQGLQTTILSGDRHAVVHAMGQELHTDTALGQQKPHDKLHYIQGTEAAMMGDGLNDMGALAAAKLSVTHAKGSTAALQFADVIMADRNLNGLIHVWHLVHQAQKARRRGFAFSLAYNITAVALALAGAIGPLIAAILMPLSSLTLVGLTYLHFPRRASWES